MPDAYRLAALVVLEKHLGALAGENLQVIGVIVARVANAMVHDLGRREGLARPQAATARCT